MRKIIPLLLILCLLSGCAGQSEPSSAPSSGVSSEVVSSTLEPESSSAGESATPAEPALADGIYSAVFDTDSSMFRVNEACGGKGTLTVENGQMTIHVSLLSKKILNLYPGTAEDAQKDGAVWLEPTTDTVTYSDGLSEEVYGFDIPVPVIGEEFDLALVGTKGAWYDHKVIVKDPEPLVENELADGTYTCELSMEGGTGKATIESPAPLRVKDGKITATLVWSSPNYDYMKVDGEKYLPTNTEGNSTFEIPVAALDAPQTVIADTVAMSTPHEVEYTLTFHSDTLETP